MPTYGKAKERDMIRSVLPSSRRKFARDSKQAIHQKRRSKVKQALHTYKDVIQTDEWYEIEAVLDDNGRHEAPYTDIHDADVRAKLDIRETVLDRRNGDKVQPIMRWAATQLQDVRLEDRLSKMATVLPDNTVGRHALSHIEDLDEYYVPYEGDRLWRYGYSSWSQERKDAWAQKRADEEFLRTCRVAALIEYVQWFWNNGLIDYLNYYMCQPYEEEGLSHWKRRKYGTNRPAPAPLKSYHRISSYLFGGVCNGVYYESSISHSEALCRRLVNLMEESGFPVPGGLC